MKRGMRAISLSDRPPLAWVVAGGRGIFRNTSTPPARTATAAGEIGRGKQGGRPCVLGGDDELGTDHARQHAPGQNPGDRLGTEAVARRIGGGESIGLV